MTGRHPKSLRPRDESAHPVVRHAIETGYLGTGQSYVISGFTSHEAAQAGRRSVNTAARHLGVSCSSRYKEDVWEGEDGSWSLQFRIFSKDSGREFIARQTGGDPSKLAYNPFRRGEPRIIADDGSKIPQ